MPHSRSRKTRDFPSWRAARRAPWRISDILWQFNANSYASLMSGTGTTLAGSGLIGGTPAGAANHLIASTGGA